LRGSLATLRSRDVGARFVVAWFGFSVSNSPLIVLHPSRGGCGRSSSVVCPSPLDNAIWHAVPGLPWRSARRTIAGLGYLPRSQSSAALGRKHRRSRPGSASRRASYRAIALRWTRLHAPSCCFSYAACRAPSRQSCSLAARQVNPAPPAPHHRHLVISRPLRRSEKGGPNCQRNLSRGRLVPEPRTPRLDAGAVALRRGDPSDTLRFSSAGSCQDQRTLNGAKRGAG
jgi:hypothetical protein